MATKKQHDNDNSDADIVPINNAVKKTGRGGKYNFPQAVDPASEDPATIRAALSSSLHWYERGTKAKCITDADFEDRTLEFLSYCLEHGERPTVEKYCLALGYVRSTVNEWEHGNNGASAARMNTIKKAKEFMASYDADMVCSGKLNPVTYIFRGKNFYHLTDQQEITLTPGQRLTDENTADIVQKYAELPAD